MSVDKPRPDVFESVSTLYEQQRNYNDRLDNACSDLVLARKSANALEGVRHVVTRTSQLTEGMNLPEDSMAPHLLSALLVAGELGDGDVRRLHDNADMVTSAGMMGAVRELALLMHEDPSTRRSTILDLRLMRLVVESDTENYGRLDKNGAPVFLKNIDCALGLLEPID